MKNFILLIVMLCLATPAMAQVNSLEVHDAVSVLLMQHELKLRQRGKVKKMPKNNKRGSKFKK